MKLLKIIGIIVLCLVTLIGAFILFIKYRINNVKDNKQLESSIEKKVIDYIDKGNSYAIVVGVYKNNKSYIKGFGTTQQGKAIPPNDSTIFELASTSKLFTTSVLQLLVESGELTLNDKIQLHLKDKVTVAKSAENTTLLHLATHLSGFPSLPNSFLQKMQDERNPYKDLKTQDIYDYLKTCNEKTTDGTFEYSNFGMGLLGHILELKTNIPYEELIKKQLLNKLGMKNTFVTIDSINKKNIVQGYNELGKPSPIWEDKVLTGAGSFLSNANDMLKFIKANLKTDETLISKALIQTHTQQLNGDTGLGWMMPSSEDNLIGNKDIVWHNGMAGGYTSYLSIDKKNNYGIIILSNKAIDVTELGVKLTRLVRTQSWEK